MVPVPVHIGLWVRPPLVAGYKARLFWGRHEAVVSREFGQREVERTLVLPLNQVAAAVATGQLVVDHQEATLLSR